MKKFDKLIDRLMNIGLKGHFFASNTPPETIQPLNERAEKKKYYSHTTKKWYSLDDLKDVRAANPELSMQVFNIVGKEGVPPVSVPGVKTVNIIKTY